MVKLNISGNEKIIIKSEKGSVEIKTNYNGDLFISGDSKHHNFDDFAYEKLFKELRIKLYNVNKEEIEKKPQTIWGKEYLKRLDRTMEFIDNYCEQVSKKLRLDKSIIIQALEKNRTYSYCNYYQRANFPNIKKVDELKKEISELNSKLFENKKEHDKEILELQKKLTKQKGIILEKREVETTFDYAHEANVNCPFCDSYQEVDLSDYDCDGEHEINQECGSCNKIFSIKVEQ